MKTNEVHKENPLQINALSFSTTYRNKKKKYDQPPLIKTQQNKSIIHYYTESSQMSVSAKKTVARFDKLKKHVPLHFWIQKKKFSQIKNGRTSSSSRAINREKVRNPAFYCSLPTNI